MPHIVGIAGSLRRQSYNLGLLRAAEKLMPDGATLDVRTIAGIPLYNADDEAAGIPPAVTALKDAIAAADGLVLATPEYNNGIPGAFKNAFDWLSRPQGDIPRVFGGKPVAVIGASPSPFGTALSQAAWLPVLRLVGTRPWYGARLLVANAGKVFDANGQLTDADTRELVRKFFTGFAQSLG